MDKQSEQRGHEQRRTLPWTQVGANAGPGCTEGSNGVELSCDKLGGADGHAEHAEAKAGDPTNASASFLIACLRHCRALRASA